MEALAGRGAVRRLAHAALPGCAVVGMGRAAPEAVPHDAIGIRRQLAVGDARGVEELAHPALGHPPGAVAGQCRESLAGGRRKRPEELKRDRVERVRHGE